MSGGRAGLFEEIDELDVSGFVPKNASMSGVRPEQVRAVSQTDFPSREPQPVLSTPSVPRPADPLRREPRRYRTGRNVQLNIKARAEAIDAFYALADRQGWVLGETFERAIEALERVLSDQK